MLFDAIRHRIYNLTEVGVLYGKSLPVWHGYFPFAQIWALDVKLNDRAKEAAEQLGSRIHLHTANAHDPSSPERLGFVAESMDIIIDDGDHSPRCVRSSQNISRKTSLP